MCKVQIVIVVISILVSVICILLTLLQHYYFQYKRLVAVKYDPVFEDLIPLGTAKSTALDNLRCDWNNPETELENFNSAAFTPYFCLDKSVYRNNENKKLLDSEVYHSLQAAVAFKLSGKKDKAKKLFEHASAIAPNNPDVLNYYGEFLEQMQEDVVKADELYSRALAYFPQHEAALSNRRRTAPVVDRMDLKLFRAIDDKRDLLKDKLDLVESFDAIKREAYYWHIYHSVSIEGNTLTLKELRYILDTGRAVAGKSIQEHNEVLGLELAMQYVKLMTRINEIGIHEILGIHRRVMGHVDPLTSGTFRDQQVFVGSHVPPPPDKVPEQMQEYIEWLNSEEAQTMHPVRYAALAHLKLVDIHPFSDGNGRTSRLLMNLILIKAGYPPVIIMKQHRKQYYSYLDMAHQGDVRPFVRFIAQCTDEVLDMYLKGATKLSIEGAPQVIEMDDVVLAN